MDKKDITPISGNAVTAMAVATGTRYMLEHVETTIGVDSAFTKAPAAACRLLAAGAFYMGKLLSDGKTSENEIIRSIEKTNMDVEVDGKNYHIDNLNMYLTAQTVHQLNMNPQEVINRFVQELKSNSKL